MADKLMEMWVEATPAVEEIRARIHAALDDTGEKYTGAEVMSALFMDAMSIMQNVGFSDEFLKYVANASFGEVLTEVFQQAGCVKARSEVKTHRKH